MKRTLVVFNSNEINLYGMSFSVRALESGLSQSWNLGIPSFLSHDAHRPIAWSRGLALHFGPGLVRLTGLCFLPENDEESKEISNIIRRYFSKHIAETATPYLPELKQRLKCYLSGKETVCTPDCVALVDENLASKVFPEVFNQQDKDRLIPLSSLVPKAPGVFEKDGLLVFAHPYFRRSFSRLNTLNEPFFKVLQKITDYPDVGIRIALDKDMVGLSSTFRPSIELEYWWGPKFSDDLSAIPVGVTRYESNEQQRLFHGISRTEFWWYVQDEVRTFECEELRDLPSFGVGHDNFGCRFVHSMLSASSATPTHLDGAIRMYDGESMINRLERNISRMGRYSEYVKLWRVDGSLSVPMWKELIAHYYRDNHLVGEYLGGEDKSERLRPHPISSTIYTASLGEYVPCDMKAGQGVRITVSYHPETKESVVGRIIRSFDFLTHASTKYNYVEADTLEIVKVLHRMGKQIELPKNVVLIAFEDMALNFPLIMHIGSDSVQLARQTQKAIAQLCKIWMEHGDDRVVSYNIGIEYADKDVYFSVAGHVADLNIWHQCEEVIFPDSASQIGEWCEIVYKVVTDIFPKANDTPPLRDMLQESGILIFKRRFLKPEEYQLHFDDNTKEVVVNLTIPKSDQNLYDAITSSQLKLACAFLVRGSKCSHCEKPYHLCNCSKYLDLDVTQVMSDISLLGPFWTNRKA